MSIYSLKGQYCKEQESPLAWKILHWPITFYLGNLVMIQLIITSLTLTIFISTLFISVIMKTTQLFRYSRQRSQGRVENHHTVNLIHNRVWCVKLGIAHMFTSVMAFIQSAS